MSQGRSIIDIIQDPAALDAFLRSSAKASTNSATNSGPQRRFDIPSTTGAASAMPPNVHFNSQTGPTLTARPSLPSSSGGGGHIFNQNTTNNTNVQITQNTFNFNTNSPSTSTSIIPQQTTPGESTTVLNQTIGSQTNVNVILNQTVIQQPGVQTTTSTNTTTGQNQQQMVAININGNQTLIPLSMLTKILQQKYATQQQPITTNTSSVPQQTTTIVGMSPQIVQNGSPQNAGQSILLQNNSNSPSPVATTTLRLVRPPTTATSNIMMMTSGQRMTTPTLAKSQSGNIIVQVTNNDNGQSRLISTSGGVQSSNTTVSTNSDLTAQLMKDLEMNGKDPEKQIARIDAYLVRMHSSPPSSSTEKDREFCTRILRYRETLSQSVEQARLNGQHRQRLLDQSTTLNTLSSSTSTPSTQQTTPKRELPQQKPSTTTSGGTTLIQLPLAKQDELLNAVLKKLRHVNLVDLQTQGILPMELTFEQKLQIQKLDMQIAALPLDKQQQFAQGQRELVPKYLAKNAASGLNTTSTLIVVSFLNPRTKILLGAVPGSATALNAANGNVARSLRISSSDLIGQQLRKDQMHVLKPDFKTRFLTRGDAIKRLTRYHVLTKPAPPAYEPTLDECRQFDETFEIEAKRLLAVSERVSESITRFTISNNQFGNNSCDAYTVEKILLDDLREQCEQEKSEFEARKRRALDVENRPIAVPVSQTFDSGFALSPPSSTYDLLLPAVGSHLKPAMSDSAYFDLFNSDPMPEETRATISDETQLAINSIVDYGVFEQHEAPIELADTSNFFFDDLDVDDNQLNNTESRDDEASRAVQNLLGYS